MNIEKAIEVVKEHVGKTETLLQYDSVDGEFREWLLNSNEAFKMAIEALEVQREQTVIEDPSFELRKKLEHFLKQKGV